MIKQEVFDELLAKAEGLMRSEREEHSPIQSVAHVYREAGREETSSSLQVFGRAVYPIDTAYQLLAGGGERYTLAWASIFDGNLIPCINETPFRGWSTRAFVDAFNLSTQGLLIPKIDFDMLESTLSYRDRPLFSDRQAEETITAILVREGTIGYFFQDPRRLGEIKPVALILEPHLPVFTEAVAAVGQSMIRSIQILREGAAHA